LNHNVFYWIRKIAGLGFGATVDQGRNTSLPGTPRRDSDGR
jgi:hypothetical protein